MKILFILSFLIIQALALEATKKNILKLKQQHIPIIDIRLPSEWKATGTIPNALKITFFNDMGAVKKDFFKYLKNNNLDKNSKFAIICRTGHRTRIASQILKREGYQNIIDLEGGMYNLCKSLLKDIK